jgi:hypothetical protein
MTGAMADFFMIDYFFSTFVPEIIRSNTMKRTINNDGITATVVLTNEVAGKESTPEVRRSVVTRW